MMNPFEDPRGSFLVLGNADGQMSLWPQLVDVPAGWAVLLGASSREACLEHVERHWTADRLSLAGGR
jgi:MbtH protein